MSKSRKNSAEEINMSNKDLRELFETDRRSRITGPCEAISGNEGNLLDETNLNDLQSLNDKLMLAEDELNPLINMSRNNGFNVE
jgi:hypothetical protein